MSDLVVDSAEATPSPVANRRRRAFIVAAAIVVIVVAGLATLLTTRHLDRQYGPIDGGYAGGPVTLHNIVSGKGGFSMSLSTAPGASAQFVEFVENEGVHSVEIKSIPTDPIVSDVQWSIYRATSGNGLGDDEPLHHFPVIVPAHSQRRLVVTIHRPSSCRNSPGGTSGGSFWTGSLAVHWKSLLHTHTTTIGFPGDYGIQVC